MGEEQAWGAGCMGARGVSSVGLSGRIHVHVQNPSAILPASLLAPEPVQLRPTPHTAAWGGRVLLPASSFPPRFRRRETDSSL